MAQGIYGTYGYQIGPNFHLLYAVYFIAKFIEAKCGVGTIAMPTHVGPMGAGFHISQRHAAVAAGLGEFGWNSIVLTPEFGPRQRFGAILTTAELEPDPMYEGEPLCNPNCRICTDMCPSGALSARGDKPARVVEYQENGKTYHYEYAHVNMSLCRVCAHGMTRKFGAKKDYVSPDDLGAEAISKGINEMMHDNLLESGSANNDFQVVPSWKCGKCLAYCPAGHWKERFHDTGLSKGPHPDKDPFGLLGMPDVKDPITGELIKGTLTEKRE